MATLEDRRNEWLQKKETTAYDTRDAEYLLHKRLSPNIFCRVDILQNVLIRHGEATISYKEFKLQEDTDVFEQVIKLCYKDFRAESVLSKKLSIENVYGEPAQDTDAIFKIYASKSFILTFIKSHLRVCGIDITPSDDTKGLYLIRIIS